MSARWYVVDKVGMATLCADEADARETAQEADVDWPMSAPHSAALLVPSSAPADEPCEHSEHVRPADGVCVECGDRPVSAPAVPKGEDNEWPDLGVVRAIVRGVCETEPADPDNPDTVCINVNELASIVELHVTDPADTSTAAQAVAAVQPVESMRWPGDFDGAHSVQQRGE